MQSEPIRNALMDLDGTLILDDKPIDGALEAIKKLVDMDINIKLFTNITGTTPDELCTKIRHMGFPFESSQIQTAVTSCAQVLQKKYRDKSFFLLVPPKLEALLGDLRKDNVKPDVVVVSDVAEGFSYENLNLILNYIDQGAELVALQKNFFWVKDGKKHLDTGAFIMGIEAATGVEALITGKPSKEFFEMAVEDFEDGEAHTIVIGDDITTDIAGARNMRSVLVKTGKFKEEQLNGDITPTWCINSIADLPALIAEQNTK
jgi:HAD superfamily hydrolase (TIGR01458 family)